MRLVLERVDDLERASRLVTWLGRPSVDEVLVTLPGLDAAKRRATAKAIRSRFNECGCAWGEIAFLLALACSIWAVRGSDLGLPAAIGTCLAASVAAAVAAKLAALAWSSWRLRVLLEQLRGEGGRDG